VAERGVEREISGEGGGGVGEIPVIGGGGDHHHEENEGPISQYYRKTGITRKGKKSRELRE